MGNRAKRVEVARLLKAKGVPTRLYKGNKAVVRKRLDSRLLDQFIYRLNCFEIGGIVNDCDSYNHRIIGWADPQTIMTLSGVKIYASTKPRSAIFQYEFNDWFGPGRRAPGAKSSANPETRGLGYGYWLRLPQVAFENGRWSCGCGYSPSPAESREEIEGGFLKYYEENPEELQKLDENSHSFKVYCWLKAGGHICDEAGIKLPEWAHSHE